MRNTKDELAAYKRCISYCTADSYDLRGLTDFFKKKGHSVRLSRDVLHVVNEKEPGDLFFFAHGCFVAWGYQKSFEDKVQKFVSAFSTNKLAAVESDYFYYEVGKVTEIDTHEKLRIDIITLQSDDPQIKLAISYGLAQSIKLEAFEESILGVIKRNNHLPEEIASRGKISLTRKAILQRMGEIFLARRSINLNMEYLDLPEFFWRNPNLEEYYVMTSKFLDIENRVSALNQRLDVLQELLDILNTQVMHIHSAWLEGIIIILIFVEILLSLFQIHLV